eukprot:5578989-Amphidinium_carterae.1
MKLVCSGKTIPEDKNKTNPTIGPSGEGSLTVLTHDATGATIIDISAQFFGCFRKYDCITLFNSHRVTLLMCKMEPMFFCFYVLCGWGNCIRCVAQGWSLKSLGPQQDGTPIGNIY